MKKIMSVLLVLTMLLGIVAMSVNATTFTPEITEYGYQNVTASYFGGQLDYSPLNCRASLTPAQKDLKGYPDGSWTVNDGDPDKGILTIDGKISEGEWGAPVVHVDSQYAADNIDIIGNPIGNATNTRFDTPSAENTYFFNNANYAPEAGLEFDLYLMWDEDYFYVAIKANDPDGAKQVHNGAEIWDGDAVQMRIDTLGPNSEFDGGQFVGGNETFTNTLTGYSDECYITPWLGETSSRTQGLEKGENYNSTLNNFIFSYITADGGRTLAYDSSARYDPTLQEYDFTNASGETVHYKGVTYFGDEVGDWNEYIEDPCYAVVRWDNLGSAKERNDVAVYEIALPWSLVSRGYEGSDIPVFSPVAGDVLGMTAVLFDAATLNTPAGAATDGYTSFLSWGNGICRYQSVYDYQTAAGSNAVTLSATPYNEVTACDHNFTPATCLAPETCTICGYQRGFASGHDNEVVSVSLPTDSKDGSINCVCNLCEAETVFAIPSDASTVYASFTTDTQTSLADTPGYTFWASAWTDGAPDGAARTLYTAEGRTKTAEDTSTFGYKVLDWATAGEGSFYSDGTPATIYGTVNPCGTYFPIDLSGGCVNSKEIAMSTEYYITDMTFDQADYHSEGLYYQFGGPSGVKYDAGLFYNQDTVYFAIGPDQILTNNPSNQGFKDYDTYFSRLNAYEIINASDITLNEWHRMTLIYDSNAGLAMLFWDDQLKLLAQDPHFALEMNQMQYFVQRRFTTPCYGKNSIASSVSWAVENYGLTCSFGGNYTLTVDGAMETHAAGETVTLNAAAFQNGRRFGAWLGDTDVLTDNVCDATFTMPDHDVTLTSKYFLVGDANDDGKINAQDANYLSQIIVGGLASVSAADINADGKVNATDSNLLTKMITGTYAPTK